MHNVQQVADFFHSHVNSLLQKLGPHEWVEDDQTRETLWALEQEISDFNNLEQDEESQCDGFVSEFVSTLSEAEDLVQKLNEILAERWNLNMPFISTSSASTDSFKSPLLGWNIRYILGTDIGKIPVVVQTSGYEIKLFIGDRLLVTNDFVDENFDLLRDFAQKRIMFNLSQQA